MENVALQNNDIYTVDEIAKSIYDVAKDYNVQKIVLFGSYARGEAKQHSDIDLYVKAGSVKFLSVCAMGMDIKELLQRNVDVLVEEHMSFSEAMAFEIEKEGIVLYEK